VRAARRIIVSPVHSIVSGVATAILVRNREDIPGRDSSGMDFGRLNAQMRALPGRMRGRVVDAVAAYLTQQIGKGASATDDVRSLSSTLLPGDVLLTDGKTRAAALVRRITQSSWAHVAMYVGALEEGTDPRCIVEADVVEGVRSVRLSQLDGLRVRILRPRGLNEMDRRRIANWVVSRIGDAYDLRHAWALATTLLRVPLAARLAATPDRMAQSATQFICSTLLAQAFVVAGTPIAPMQLRPREQDAADHRYVTPRDFENAAIFEVVRPRPA
jgi:hypothetical protein